jgi:hypothetical protein
VYTPIDDSGSVRYAGLIAFGSAVFSAPARVLLGSWHMSATDSAQMCWRLEQHEMRTLPDKECHLIPWAPTGLEGEPRYRWIREHEPFRFRALGKCEEVPDRQDWEEVYGRPFPTRRIPDVRTLRVTNPEKHDE